MRRLVIVLLALAFPSAAGAADLVVAPGPFSPTAKRLSIQATLPSSDRAGLQLATSAGRPLGWIVPPQQRRFLTLRWDRRLGRSRVPDGRYLIRLVAGNRMLAASPIEIDRTAPAVTTITARNRSRLPFQGDNKRFTTISPNGDKLRESPRSTSG